MIDKAQSIWQLLSANLQRVCHNTEYPQKPSKSLRYLKCIGNVQRSACALFLKFKVKKMKRIILDEIKTAIRFELQSGISELVKEEVVDRLSEKGEDFVENELDDKIEELLERLIKYLG